MPNQYTKEQIDEAHARIRGIREISAVGGKPTHDETLMLALGSALSTAEKNNADWQEYNAELLHRAETAESERDTLKAQVAELEAIPDRLRKLDISLCPEPHGEWSLLDGEKEIAFFGDSIESVIKQAEAAIVGKKEG